MKRTFSTSAASADARADTPSSSEQPNTEESNNKFAKKDSKSKPTRFNKKPQGRRGGAAYTKTPTNTSLQIVPRLRTFPIFTSNIGCREVTRIVYNVIQGRDFRLAQNITSLQLTYVTTLAFTNRVVQCALANCTAIPEGASRLKQAASGIQLPAVLAKYIESVGSLELLSGVTVVPHCDDYTAYVDTRLMLDPATILEEADREVPPGDWALDIEWITSYNSATTRASRSGMNFRSIDNSQLNGSPEMLVSYRIVDDLLLPKAPQRMSEAEAQLGAAYRFRDFTDKLDWIGPNRELLFDGFTAIPFDPRIVISDVCVAAFQGNYVSTN